MKKIEAIIRPQRLLAVSEALRTAGIAEAWRRKPLCAGSARAVVLPLGSIKSCHPD